MARPSSDCAAPTQSLSVNTVDTALPGPARSFISPQKPNAMSSCSLACLDCARANATRAWHCNRYQDATMRS